MSEKTESREELQADIEGMIRTMERAANDPALADFQRDGARGILNIARKMRAALDDNPGNDRREKAG